MKVGIMVFPGSNCDRDCYYAVKEVLNQDVFFIWHQDSHIPESTDMMIVPGGFSYGDYLRAGAIAGRSRSMDQIREFAEKGKLVLGICNGFQILTESHLLPGTLMQNESLKFICKDVYLKTENIQTPFTKNFKPGQVIKLPIAHGEGNYFIDEAGLADLKKNNQIVFRYCGPQGETNAAFNPNGALENIAGIINKKGNILGLMPHPERAVESLLGSTHGIDLLSSALKSLTA